MTDRKKTIATLIGGTAVLMWGTLALFTALSGDIPPFQLTAMAFGVAALLLIGKWIVRGEKIAGHLRAPFGAWALGIGGLFGYHFVYFLALRNAPVIEAGLIAYLWPLMIVLFSAALPGERLRWFHILGAALGLLGATLLITGGKFSGFKAEYALGYALAFACAFIWSGYSVLNRRFAHVPSDSVGGFCAVVAILSLLAHFGFEETLWPDTPIAWLSVLGLGLFPLGLAFFAWDFGTKKGDIQVLGAFSYAAPLISTLVLIGFGLGEPSRVIFAACLLIIGGAVISAKELFLRG